MTLKAALDTSSANAAFAVVDGHGDILLELNGIPLGRETGGLTQSVITGLAEADIALDAIRQWTIGMGPGSFSGIRIGAAFVKGICAGTGAAYRGVPSGQAMARAAEPTVGSTIAALSDGRRGDVLVSPYRFENEELIPVADPHPLPIADLPSTDFNRFVIMGSDRALGEVQTVGVNNLVVLDTFPALGLIQATGGFAETVSDMEASVTPVYVRPAVFTPPVIRK